MRYTVYVGNVGLVHDGQNKKEALKAFAEYKSQSSSGYGRAANEEVVLMADDEPVKQHGGGLSYRKGTFEHRINELIQQVEDDCYSAVFFELWNDGEGWSVNNAWRAESNSSRRNIIELLRNRWEVVKANYFPKARVADIIEDGEGDTTSLTINGVAFAEVIGGCK